MQPNPEQGTLALTYLHSGYTIRAHQYRTREELDNDDNIKAVAFACHRDRPGSIPWPSGSRNTRLSPFLGSHCDYIGVLDGDQPWYRIAGEPTIYQPDASADSLHLRPISQE